MRISDWSSDVCSSDLFGPNLGSGIGRHGVQGIMLLTRAALGNAINAATGCKDEIADPRLGGKLAQPDGGIQIDSFGHFLETLAHRVVGNGRQVDHRVSVSQQARSAENTYELQYLMRISY